jgi:hypothetical protein
MILPTPISRITSSSSIMTQNLYQSAFLTPGIFPASAFTRN